MQRVKTHMRWFRSNAKLQISAFLVSLLLAGSLSYIALIPVLHQSGDALAKDAPDTTVKVEEVSKPKTEDAVKTEETPTQTVVTPTPKPVAAQPVAATPAPSYDRVSIPSVGLNSRYVSVGLTASGNIDVHPSLVGLYTGNAQPGTPGAVFLDGHNPGVFSSLPSTGVGAQITITKANGEQYNYTVVHTETVQLEGINMRRALRVYGGKSEGVNLMTCVGAYNPATGTTDQRFIVYAVRS